MKMISIEIDFPSLLRLVSLVAVAVFGGMVSTGARAAGKPLESPERGFISVQPARTWEEGLISGNGTIGANVLSRPLDETIIFTHERLFIPDGEPILPPLMAPKLAEVRKLIDQGQYKQATKLAFDVSQQKGFMYPDPFVPAFDLRIKTESTGDVKKYARSVDFETGVATVQWSDDRGQFERKLFVSRKDGLAVLSITGPGEGNVDLSITLAAREPNEKLGADTVAKSNRLFKEKVKDVTVKATPESVTFRNNFTLAYNGSIHALEGIVLVEADGGTTRAEGDKLVVSGANSVLAFIDLDVLKDPKKSKLPAMKKAIAELPRDFDKLLEGHAAIHGEMFRRMKLDIGGGEDHKLPTEMLLTMTNAEKLNNALIEKEFDAGRYNILSCTGELPPTLQGVWAGTYCPNWASDYTHNGNVPSAIAANLSGNMPELMLAYTNYIESIEPYLELNAKRIFGCRGVVLPSRSTTHGMNNAFAPTFAGSFWVAGAPWAAHFFYDYYLYTGDEKFLKEKAYPLMVKCCDFFEDYCYEGPDGKYVFSPTQSPENTPRNTDSQGTFNSTMDIAAAREVLQNTIKVSKQLGLNKDRIPVWKKMLTKLPDYSIDPAHGTVKEWTTPRLEEQLNHRHSSQLYALYDGMPPEIEKNPKLREAFKKIIDYKLNTYWKGNARGFMSFGVVQLGQAATSLRDKDLAYECLIHLVNRYWLNNLASMHNHKHLFNMDISGGMPHVIIKMLVASDPGRIQLLPALPDQWPKGSMEGILCRGQIEIKKIAWDKTEGMVEVTLVSQKDQTVLVDLPAKIEGTAVEGGTSKSAGERAIKLTLKADTPATVKINMKW